MATNDEYIKGRRADRRYFSKQFIGGDDHDLRPKRFAYLPLEETDRDQFAVVKGQVVLHTTPAGKQEIRALFYTDRRQIDSLIFERVSTNTQKPSATKQFCLRGAEVDKLLEFVSLIRAIEFEDSKGVRLDEGDHNFSLPQETLKALARREPELLAEIAEQNITSRDVTAISYRKKQLDLFRSLLGDPSFFAEEMARRDVKSKEALWQSFFEQNRWIFGYGLFYVFTTGLDEKKLEQYVVGASIGGRGKRADAVLRTRGRVSSMCFVEIKTHETPLLATTQYRADVWRPSDELSGAVAQIHRTVDATEKQLREHYEGRDDDGNPSGELVYLWRPRSIVVVGSLAEFEHENSVNERRFSSFELFRRQLAAPEILTFDELYERARYITDTQAG